ncbi:MAG: DNA mismatch repair protein MutS, partial [Parachlamydiaceae bacterium]
VGFTKVSGFYIEVSRGQTEKVPSHFQRRQTLTNAERYITADLKDYEEKVLTAEEKANRLEMELFQQLRDSIKPHYDEILKTAKAIAQIDALLSLANVAKEQRYIRPTLDDSDKLIILGGRHPVIEAKGQEAFIPNDTKLDIDTRLMLITGPNMAGKSTYIRQVALICIMAQIGSFVPARSAHIGLIDKVFTRIGASDDLTRGQSTFMVEMTETANILNNVTQKSLVILDEIGRGTSTYDGISIAWSVAEHLLINENRRAKTLFATHFWELTKLEEKKIGAKNYTIAVHESMGEITFLRKIIEGGTDKSYGIHVAKLAGLPKAVIDRAHEILTHLEETSNRNRIFEPGKPKKPKPSESQLNLF